MERQLYIWQWMQYILTTKNNYRVNLRSCGIGSLSNYQFHSLLIWLYLLFIKYDLDIEIKKQTNFKILWDKNDIDFIDVKVDVQNATVVAYVTHNYQIADINDPSFEGTFYTIQLNKSNNKWLITEIKSNDAFDQAYSESGMSVDEMLNTNNIQIEETAESVKAKKESMEKRIAALRAFDFIDTPYDRSKAQSYAKTYASYATRNANFIYYNSENQTDCQSFASQCVWSGFGGVPTDSASIEAKLFPMCNLGSSNARSWYQTKNGNTPLNWSWTSCTSFKNYLDDGGNVLGPYGFELSGIAHVNIRDVIHVVWDENGLRHAMVVTGFTPGSILGSRTRSEIYVSAHSSDKNNVPLTTIVTADKNKLYTQVIGGNLQYK